MFKPIRILLATLVIAGAGSAALARTPAAMPGAMPVALSGAMPAPPPAAAMIFRQVTRLGTTKPAGAALDARNGTNLTLDAESRRLDHLIRTAVCLGC